MTEPGAADESFDPAALEMLHRLGKASLVVRMIDLFLAKTPERITEAHDALQAGDLPTLERAVHSLKSSAGQLGGVRLQHTAAIAEKAAAAGDRATAAQQLEAIDTEFAAFKLWLERAKVESTITSTETPS